MALPAPDLDDRRFQDLVDDAKRLVQQRCPEWTDHNVSDPGVTLIETFAFVVDQLLYRVNRIPDRSYVKFLELMGVTLHPPTAARADVTFWLSAAQEGPVTIAAGTEAATARTERDDEVLFTVEESLEIVACSLTQLFTQGAGDEAQNRTPQLESGQGRMQAFSNPPQVGDTVLLGLSDATPSCAVLLRFTCEVEGVGVDPRDPPLAWEAWDGKAWMPCELERDTTGGLNRAGEVVVHVPHTHTVSVIGGQRAGWLRCRVLAPRQGQPPYSTSPRIDAASAMTIGGTTRVAHARVIHDEVIGLSEGVPGQRFPLAAAPVVPDAEPSVLDVAGGDGWEPWRQVADFSESGPDDQHFVLDATEGAVVLGPAVRLEDGTLRGYGAVPAKGAPLRLRRYASGGGRAGNVDAGRIDVLKTSQPYVASVVNRRAAVGGVEAEDIDQAKVRGPLALRTRNRAVTPEDHEHLARQAAPEIARVRCVRAGTDGTAAGGVRLLVVPSAGDIEGRLAFGQLVPEEATLERISRFLEDRRMVGARIAIEPPTYQGVTVVARLRARQRVNADRLAQDALEALYRYIHPISGGPDGGGWPFGRPLHVGEAYAVLQRLQGTEFVEDARLFRADPVSGERGESVQRIELGPNALVFSYEHQVLVR